MKHLTLAVLVALSVSVTPSRALARETCDCEALRRDFVAYTDRNGLVEPDRDPVPNLGAGNGVLYTSEMFVFLAKRGCATDEDRDRFVALVRSLEVEPGLINRNPPRGPHLDQEAHDDYIGLVAAAHLLGGKAQKIADEVHSYGASHRWLYNNVRPGTLLDDHDKPNLSPLFARFPAVLAHFAWAANREPSPVLASAWAATIASGPRDGQPEDQIVLEWIMVQVLPDSAPFECRLAARAWSDRFAARFPGGLAAVLGKQFRDPKHPLIIHAPRIEKCRHPSLDESVREARARAESAAKKAAEKFEAKARAAAAELERAGGRLERGIRRLRGQ